MTTKKIAVAAAFAMAFALSACNKQEDASQAAVEEQAPAVVLPTDPADTGAWKAYLRDVVTQNMQGVTTTRPYMYFVPAGDDGKATLDRANQLDNVQTVIARGVLPGNMVAFGGPDSTITADLVVDAFAQGSPGTFKDVFVLFVGAQADSDRVKEAVSTVGATYRFAEMK